MSRAIQVQVSASESRTIHVEDGVRAPLEMLPILSRERMADLLAAELAGIGFERDGDIARRSSDSGLVVEVDLRAATVTVRLADESHERAKVTLRGRVYREDTEAAKDRLRAKTGDALDDKFAQKADKLRQEISTKLEGTLGDVRAELDAAIGRATIAALTERAGELGEIESLVDDGAGNVTIKVKL